MAVRSKMMTHSTSDNSSLPEKRPAFEAPAVWLAKGFGVGLMPVAPGTFGTLLGLPLAWAVQQISPLWLQGVGIVLMCCTSVLIGHVALPRIARGKDPGCVVIDEIVSVPITFFLVPMTSVSIAVLGFLLFRLFDITKPPPARQLEKLPGAWGVMADDWAAGVYANLGLWLILAYAPASWFAT